MVKAQEYIKKTFSHDTEEIIIPRGLQLDGSIDLSSYNDLKLISMIDCGLVNFNFLSTIPNKKNLIKLDLGHNPVKFPDYQKGLELIGEFTNLEWVSLFDVPAGEGNNLKPVANLTKCHTFLLNNKVDIGGFEYFPLSVKNHGVDWLDNWRKRKENQWAISLAQEIIKLEQKLAHKNQELTEKTLQLQKLTDDLTKERNENKVKIAQKEAENKKLETDLATATDKITTLTQENNTLTTERDNRPDITKDIHKELQIQLSQLKEENQSLQNQVKNLEKTNSQTVIQAKTNELEEIKEEIIKKNNLDEEVKEELEDILELQSELINNSSSVLEKQLEKNKKRLNKKIPEEEINSLCQIQQELTKLQAQEKNLETKIEVSPK